MTAMTAMTDMPHLSALTLMLGLVASIALAGCQTVPVQAWEKKTLGQDTMKADGPVPALSRIDGHVYYSKEGVRGGTGVGGGGCGCN